MSDIHVKNIPLAKEIDKLGILLTRIIMSNKKCLPKQVKRKNKDKKGTIKL